MSLLQKLEQAKKMQAGIKEASEKVQESERKTDLSTATTEHTATAAASTEENSGAGLSPLERARLSDQKRNLKRAELPKAEQEMLKPVNRADLEPQTEPKAPAKKMTLKERIAAKKAAKQAEVVKEELPIEPKEEPKATESAGFDRAAYLKEQKEKRHAELVAKREQTVLPQRAAEPPYKTPEETKADYEEFMDREEAKAQPEPAAKESIVERMRRKRLEKQQAANKAKLAPKKAEAEAEQQVVKEAQEEPSLPQHTAVLDRAGANPRVEVERTPIQGAPQVKEEEAKREAESGVADNRKDVPLNAQQKATATMFVEEQKSCVMIGPAGSGKTTGVRGVVTALQNANALRYTADFKRQGGYSTTDRVKDQPNIAIVAFTRRAAINIKEAVTSLPHLEEFRYCCQTIHNLLEYSPVYYEEMDDETGEWKKKMKFEPQRDAARPLDIDYLIVEEASMVDPLLWAMVLEALPPHVRVLFLGDINQLPPVFGLPILAYAMHKLPVVELTEVYRQSMGPVLRAAHNILQGKQPVFEQSDDGQSFLAYEEFKTDKGSTSIKQHNVEKGNPVMMGEHKLANLYTSMFRKLFEAGRYDPEQDMIISPFNVGELGTLNMNNCLAQFIGDARDAVVHEIIAGFQKHYLAVGDKVMVERQDGVITEIKHNPDYMGSLPKPAGLDLSRFGVRIMGKGGAEEIDMDEEHDTNFDLDAIGEKSAEELKRSASHIVIVELESGETVTISSSGQFAPEKFTLGYCITGHKSQGSEWRGVYIIMHKRHHSLLSREWLYTTVTRAKQNCTLLTKPYSIEKAIANQRITGDSLEDKIAWFTSGAVDNLDEIEVVPS